MRVCLCRNMLCRFRLPLTVSNIFCSSRRSIVLLGPCTVTSTKLPSSSSFHVNGIVVTADYFKRIQNVRWYAQKKGGKHGNKKGDEDEGSDEPINFDRKDLETKMAKRVDVFAYELANVRTGRANPNMVENIKVKLEDNSTVLLKNISSIVVKNARLLSINVFDPKNVPHIIRAINDENLGFNPQAKGNTIDIPVPKMTQEIREKVVKMMKRTAEETKEKIRLIRRDGIAIIKKIKNAPKDDIFKLEKEVQTLTDEYTKKVDDLLLAKEKEILQNA